MAPNDKEEVARRKRLHGERPELAITGLDADGLGEASWRGVTVKVEGTVPGDVVRVHVHHASPHRPVVWATLEDVLERGSTFQQPPCPWAAPVRGRCGGCPVQHLKPAARRDLLTERVVAVLEELRAAPEAAGGELPAVPDLQVTGPSEGYRNRANYVLERRESGQVRLGSWAPRTHQVARMDDCLVARPPIAEVAWSLSVLLEASPVSIGPPSPEEPDTLRYVTIRSGEDGTALVDLVVSTPNPPWLDDLLDAVADLPRVAGVAVSVNPTTGNALRVAPSEPRRGRRVLRERVGEGDLMLHLPLTAAAFFQLNSTVAGAMYRRAAAWAAPDLARCLAATGEAELWDLYSGVGGLGLTVLRGAMVHAVEAAAGAATRQGEAAGGVHEPASPRFHLRGAEGVEETVDLARQAVQEAGLGAQSEHRVVDLASEEDFRAFREAGSTAGPAVVLVNPPRRGLHEPVVSWLERWPRERGVDTSARHLLYMSCNPETFARDAQRLLTAGWRLQALEAHDMLPHTVHVELLGWFVQIALETFEDLRRELVPHAEAQGYLTDDDIFRDVS